MWNAARYYLVSPIEGKRKKLFLSFALVNSRAFDAATKIGHFIPRRVKLISEREFSFSLSARGYKSLEASRLNSRRGFVAGRVETFQNETFLISSFAQLQLPNVFSYSEIKRQLRIHRGSERASIHQFSCLA